MDKYSFGAYRIIPGEFLTVTVIAEDENNARQLFNAEMTCPDAPISPIAFKNFHWNNGLAVTEPQIVIE